MKNTFLDKVIRNLRSGQVIKEISPGAIVCDFGCDEGHFLREISPRISKGFGIDRRTKALKEGNLSFIQSNLESPIPELKADAVTMLAVLEHLNEPKKVVLSAYKTLNSKGKLILTTPSPLAKPVLEALAKLKVIDENEIKDHKHYFSKSELIALLKETGFKNVTVKSFELGMNLLAVGEK